MTLVAGVVKLRCTVASKFNLHGQNPMEHKMGRIVPDQRGSDNSNYSTTSAQVLQINTHKANHSKQKGHSQSVESCSSSAEHIHNSTQPHIWTNVARHEDGRFRCSSSANLRLHYLPGYHNRIGLIVAPVCMSCKASSKPSA